MMYPWYEVLDKTDLLKQGDFIPHCPLIIPPASMDGEEIVVDIEFTDSIILSQSCDLVNEKIDIVLVCPFYPLKMFLDNLPPDQTSSAKFKKKIIDNLRQGNLPGYHLIEKFPGYFADYQVVEFRNVYGIQIDSLKAVASSMDHRIRLLPPYREHLSQAFARFFMRVGLPQDITVDGY
jgi:hypothetical protein